MFLRTSYESIPRLLSQMSIIGILHAPPYPWCFSTILYHRDSPCRAYPRHFGTILLHRDSPCPSHPWRLGTILFHRDSSCSPTPDASVPSYSTGILRAPPHPQPPRLHRNAAFLLLMSGCIDMLFICLLNGYVYAHRSGPASTSVTEASFLAVKG